MKKICPCCNGSGQIEEMSPVYLPPLQYRVWDIVRRSGDGIAFSKLIDKVYADEINGGPICAKQSVYVSIHKLNERMKSANQRIIIRGSICHLEHLKPDR